MNIYVKIDTTYIKYTNFIYIKSLNIITKLFLQNEISKDIYNKKL